jgi:hypothetical protein
MTLAATSASDRLTPTLAVAAVLISLLAVVVPAATGSQQRKRDDRAKRAEMYLELVQHVEHFGLWVVDEAYDRTETDDPDYIDGPPRRNTDRPPRPIRVRIRAIVSAYGSEGVIAAHRVWAQSLDVFEAQLDYADFIEHNEGRYSADENEIKHARDDEVQSRHVLVSTVNMELRHESWGARYWISTVGELWVVLTGRKASG